MILTQPKPVMLTVEQERAFTEAKEFYHENMLKYSFIYRYFPFLFKKKIAQFLEKSDYYFEISRRKTEVFKYKVAQVLASGDYYVNGFSHYIFKIDGVEHKYGVLEISDDIFETARFLMAQQEKENNLSTNIVQLKK